MSDFDVLRRIAERGLKLSQEEVEKGRLDPRGHLDLWTHVLDEMERAKDRYEPDVEDMEVIELNINVEDLATLALAAHKANLTLNEYINDVLREYIHKHGLKSEETL